MKSLFTILSALFTITCSGQSVNLKWKIGENEKVNYLTVISEIDTSEFNIDFKGFFKSFSDSTGKGLSETNNFFKKLNQSMKNIDFVSTLTNDGNNIIDIVMSAKSNEKNKEVAGDTDKIKSNELVKLIQSFNEGIMLRGSVYANGGIHSFWVKSNQKNLIATLFELPTKPIKIGDTWKIDVNLISNDQNFICDSSYKINEVTLSDIRIINAETIAVIKYNIVEYVKGKFHTPSFLGGSDTETMMQFTHRAIAEFSVDKGRWLSYDGIMSLDASGILTAKKKTKFTLLIE